MSRGTYYSVFCKVLLTGLQRPAVAAHPTRGVYFRFNKAVQYFPVAFIVYPFTCSHGTAHVYLKTGCLSKRVSERHPVLLSTGINKISTGGFSHFVDLNRSADASKIFRSKYKF